MFQTPRREQDDELAPEHVSALCLTSWLCRNRATRHSRRHLAPIGIVFGHAVFWSFAAPAPPPPPRPGRNRRRIFSIRPHFRPVEQLFYPHQSRGRFGHHAFFHARATRVPVADRSIRSRDISGEHQPLCAHRNGAAAGHRAPGPWPDFPSGRTDRPDLHGREDLSA